MLSFKLWEGHLKDIEGAHVHMQSSPCSAYIISGHHSVGEFGNGPVPYFLCLCDFFFWPIFNISDMVCICVCPSTHMALW